MKKHSLFIFAIVLMTLVVFPSSFVSATTDPIVIEELLVFPFGDTQASYTVVNPTDSSIGDIVGFVIEVDYSWNLQAFTTNGWIAQGVTAAPINATTWDQKMSGSSALTWREFFGGIDYTFARESVGYYVNYNEIATDTYKFDWSSSNAPYHLPILPGETLGGFYAYMDLTASEYLLAYINNSENDTFDHNGLNYFHDEAVPEPATVGLIGLGALLIRRNKR